MYAVRAGLEVDALEQLGALLTPCFGGSMWSQLITTTNAGAPVELRFRQVAGEDRGWAISHSRR